MTAVNQQETGSPDFAHAVRGYDRYQVDEYLERMNEWVAGAQARAEEAERYARSRDTELNALRQRLREAEEEQPTVPDQVLKEAAERARAAVATAVAQADEIRRITSEDADRRSQQAQEQALQIVEAAHRAVSGLSEEAANERRESRHRADAVMEEAHRRVEQLNLEAAQTAEKVVSEGRAEAKRLIDEAKASAEETRRASEEERLAASETVRRLLAEREEIVDELSRLKGALHTLISGAQTITRFESQHDPESGQTTTVMEAVIDPDANPYPPGDGARGSGESAGRSPKPRP